MAKQATNKKKTVSVDIQFQIRVAGTDSQPTKTYEYATEGALKTAKAHDEDPYKREIRLLKFLAKEFKSHARAQEKKLLAKRKKVARGKTA